MCLTVAAAGVTGFLALGGHFIPDDPPLHLHAPSERELARRKAADRRDLLSKLAEHGPNGPVSSDAKPDAAIAAIVGEYHIGPGWVVTISAGTGAQPAVDARHYGQRAKQRTDEWLRRACPGGLAVGFTDGGERFDVYIGTPGNDVIRADFGASGCLMFGMGGDDVLSGTSGRDLLIGGPGKDTYFGNGGEDEIRRDAEDPPEGGPPAAGTINRGGG